MYYSIDEDFTHNEMIIEGKDAVNFLEIFSMLCINLDTSSRYTKR